ncbi:unnamed protein product [Cunninghamella blakesleeana]
MNRVGNKNISSPSSPSLAPLMGKESHDEEADISITIPPLTWDQLRRQARQIENEIELKLVTLSKVGALNSTQQQGLSSDINKGGQELEIEQLLNNLQDTIVSMGHILDQPSATPTNPSMTHMLDRHKNILYDYTKEFKRTKANIKAARDKADLMNQVQDEIRIFNAGNSNEADYYLTERNRVESSHRMTDMILE